METSRAETGRNTDVFVFSGASKQAKRVSAVAQGDIFDVQRLVRRPIQRKGRWTEIERKNADQTIDREEKNMD